MFESEELDRALDRLVDGAEVGSVDLIEPAVVIVRARAVPVDPVARVRIRDRFLAKAVQLKPAQAVRPRRWKLLTGRRLVAASMAMLLSSSGLVYAASGAMPDSSLYAVKRSLEAAALRLTLEPERAALRRSIAIERLREARYLLRARGNSSSSLAGKLLREARREGAPDTRLRAGTLLREIQRPAGGRSVRRKDNSSASGDFPGTAPVGSEKKAKGETRTPKEAPTGRSRELPGAPARGRR